MIRILTDSSSDLEKEELKALGVICVPLSVTFGEDTYQDGFNLSKDMFYEKLADSGEIPKTAQPAPEMFLQHFNEAKEAGDTVIAILLSSGLSGTYQSAVIAQGMADYENIYIVDSKTAVAGVRILIDLAVKMRGENKSAEEITSALESLKGRIKILTAVDTLEYLHKGGRLTKSQFMLGNLVNIKPIVSLDENGKIYAVDKGIGRMLTCKKMLEYTKSDGVDENHKMYFLYFNQKKNAEKLIEYMKTDFPFASADNLTNVGPTIASHVGAGAFGVVFVKKQ